MGGYLSHAVACQDVELEGRGRLSEHQLEGGSSDDLRQVIIGEHSVIRGRTSASEAVQCTEPPRAVLYTANFVVHQDGRCGKQILKPY